jgi:hypothetical protein
MRGTGRAQESMEANADGDCRNRRRQIGQRRGEVKPMISDALIEEINSAYRRLKVATEDLASADRELAEHIRRVRLDNAEAILEAKNERTASLYLDGLLDTKEHRRLEGIRARADLDLQHARREVDRLHLIVRLLGTQANEVIGR